MIVPDDILKIAEVNSRAVSLIDEDYPAVLCRMTQAVLLISDEASGTLGIDGILNEISGNTVISIPENTYIRIKDLRGKLWKVSAVNSSLPPGIYSDGSGTVRQIAERLSAEYDRNDRSERMVSAITEEIAAETERSCKLEGEIRTADGYDYLRYIDTNSDSITLQTFAEHFHFTEQYASSLISKKLNVSFTELVRTIRMAKSIPLLEGTARTCADIAAEIGYASQEHFSRVFSQFFGTTPFKFRSEMKLRRIRRLKS